MLGCKELAKFQHSRTLKGINQRILVEAVRNPSDFKTYGVKAIAGLGH
jgi:hypothetical protein